MVDFNELADSFADIVADKVAARLSDNWPNTKLSIDQTIHDYTLDNKTNTILVRDDDGGFVKPDGASIIVTNNKVVSSDTDEDSSYDKVARAEALNKVNVRTLRNTFANAEGKEPTDYNDLTKSELVDNIVTFEIITGRLYDGEPEDDATDVEDDVEPDPEPDDEEPLELTREIAMGMDLEELKLLAIDNGLTEADLEGHDVKAIVDLLFGDEEAIPVDEDVEEEDELELDIENIEDMSLGELKTVAEQINEAGGTIKFDRKTSRDQLIVLIMDSLDLES